MKKTNSIITNLILISIFAAFGCITAMAQRSFAESPVIPIISAEKRPFDFSDKFYSANGVEPSLIFSRVSGTDESSVFDKTGDETRNNVRVIATRPAYNYDGSALYWNLYGELYAKSFVQNEAGRQAMKTANNFPIFVFPSATERGTNRQSSLIDAGKGYFETNPLGLSVVVKVEYNRFRNSDDGEEILQDMARRNGVSLDGTPIIKTVDEINLLTRMGIVTQTIKGLNGREPSYAIAKVMENPKESVTPDAFLMYIKGGDGNPLEAENFFIKEFESMQDAGLISEF